MGGNTHGAPAEDPKPAEEVVAPPAEVTEAKPEAVPAVEGE